MTAQISQQNLETWADYLLDHSMDGIGPDDVVMIKGEHICWPLISVLQDKIFAAGGLVDLMLVPPDNDRGRAWGASIARHGTVEQIRKVPAWWRQRYEEMTKYIEVLGAESPSLYTDLPDETGMELLKAEEPQVHLRLAKPWVLTLFPTQGFADMEGMSLEEYTDVIVSASTVDPRLLEECEAPLREVMDASDTVRLVTEHPATGKTLELSMNIGGRVVLMCTGKRNFPDGEVYTSPDARSVEGEIYVDMPVSYSGTTIQGIHLRFEGGVIKEYSAEEGSEALSKIIETDDGSHRLGEIALGMNAGMKRVLRHPLFVEKVGGTAHIAIGASYADGFVEEPNSEEGKARVAEYEKEGSFNKSAQHVDIVTDFRPGGAGRALYLGDTKLEIRDNIWVVA